MGRENENGASTLAVVEADHAAKHLLVAVERMAIEVLEVVLPALRSGLALGILRAVLVARKVAES